MHYTITDSVPLVHQNPQQNQSCFIHGETHGEAFPVPDGSRESRGFLVSAGDSAKHLLWV